MIDRWSDWLNGWWIAWPIGLKGLEVCSEVKGILHCRATNRNLSTWGLRTSCRDGWGVRGAFGGAWLRCWQDSAREYEEGTVATTARSESRQMIVLRFSLILLFCMKFFFLLHGCRARCLDCFRVLRSSGAREHRAQFEVQSWGWIGSRNLRLGWAKGRIPAVIQSIAGAQVAVLPTRSRRRSWPRMWRWRNPQWLAAVLKILAECSAQAQNRTIGA